MPTLILLNGAPASGKSTLAARFVDTRPMALCLDLDVVRGLLGGWLGEPINAGLRARALALSMAATHLSAGFDVVVPQYLGRTAFIEELAQVAAAADASFVEVVLHLDRASAKQAFDDRRSNPTHQTHLDAAALVDQSDHIDPVGEMWDALQIVLAARPNTLRVEIIRGDIDTTFRRLTDALGGHGPTR